MKTSYYLIFAFAILTIVGCKENTTGFSGKTVKFGSAKYYHSFLGLKDDTIVLQKN